MAVMKFNLLQAYCGTGKGLASHQGQPQTVDFTAENPFCRFKVWEGSMILLMVSVHIHSSLSFHISPLLLHFSSIFYLPLSFLSLLLPSSPFLFLPLPSPSSSPTLDSFALFFS